MANKFYTNEEKQDEDIGTDIGANSVEQSAPVILSPQIISPYFKTKPSGDVIIGDYDNYGGAWWDQSESRFTIKANSLKLGSVIKSVAPGDDIQDAIDEVYAAGGGEIILQNGIHYVATDLNLYSNTYIRGQNTQSTVINFMNGVHGFVAQGSNAYSTGTISITVGGTTVTGAGTVWTAGMAGQSIMLSGLWYPITTINTGAQTLTIAIPYANDTLAGASYVIATTINDFRFQDFTIQASLSAGIKIQYADFFWMQNVIIVASNIGIDIDDASRGSILITDAFYCATATSLTNFHYFVLNECGFVDMTSNAVDIISCANSTITSNFLSYIGGDGIRFTNSGPIKVDGNTIKYCGGQGIEFVSGNNGIQIISTECSYNTSDGIKLTATSDGCFIANCQLTGNGGYGINIVAATCDNNFIGTNQYTSNVSGNFVDGGTSTIIINTNQIILDTAGFIRGGQTAYNTGAGFFLGYSGGAYKFSIGNPAGNYLTWDGSNLSISSQILHLVGDNLYKSADTQRNSNIGSWTMKKEIQVFNGGTYRVKFTLWMTGGTTGRGRIYKNGVAFGTERTGTTTPTEYSEDLVFSAGDLIQIYVIRDSGGDSIICSNFRLYLYSFDSATVNTD